MGKKKFSRDDDGCNSTDDESTNSVFVVGSSVGSNPSCPHVGKAVQLSELKKNLRVSFVRIGKCTPCEREKKSDSTQKMRLVNGGPNDAKKKGVANSKKTTPAPPSPVVSTLPKIVVDPEVPHDVWLCLRCAGQSCSPKTTPPAPSSVSHAMQHFETPRSDQHCIVLNVETWTLWCFECKSELYIDSYKKLHEAVDHVKRIADKKSVAATATSNIVIKKDFSQPGLTTTLAAMSSKNVSGTASSVLPRARGLNNLGNTCFFNSVMQCLSSTHSFVKFLDTHCQKGAPLNLPAVTVHNKVQRDDSGLGNSRSGSTQSDDPDQDQDQDPIPDTIQLDPLSLQLAEAGAITLAVAAFFKEMHSIGNTKSGPVNPGHLFGQICRRSPQFRGFQQQDAHELLRHLMDGLRTEEVRRQRTAILKHFGLTEKTDPKKVDDKIRRKVNALSKHSNYTIVDKIFGGHLVSTIVCEQCHNSSQIYEPFLDLSLPLIDQKPPRPGGGWSASKNSKNVSNGKSETSKNDSVDVDDADDMSCFGRSKKKADAEVESSKSKHQIKKERTKAKKEKRKNRNKNFASGDKEDPPSDDEKDEPENPDSKPDDAESKLDETESRPEDNESKREDSEPKLDEVEPKLENSETKEEKVENCDQPESNVDECVSDAMKEMNISKPHDDDATMKPEFSNPGNENVINEESQNQEETISDGEEAKMKKELNENEKNSSAKKESKQSVKKPVNSNKKKSVNNKKNGSEEEEEDDGYSEENEDDWEWDYGEQWKEGEKKEEEENGEKDQDSDYLEVDDVEEQDGAQQVKQSLNPLPAELLARGSSEREKSSERLQVESEDDAAETGASVNGDVEDNLDDGGHVIVDESSTVDENAARDAKLADPYCPDSNHLDPHMESLCRRVRKLSVAASNVVQDETSNELVESNFGFEQKKAKSNDSGNDVGPDEIQVVRLRQEWIARSLTSIAPRYHSRTGECSIYSSLSQFTAPELLTGSNKWACDRCTQLASTKLRAETDAKDSDEEEREDDEQNKETKKPQTVYSNASKQLLIFSPPAVLTIHLKRFQQTMCGLRKDNRHVDFPFSLNLAPFCSATSLSATNVPAGSQEILYDLFGVVEHSGSLQGGHYTAFVKVRPTNSANFGDKFHSEPTTRSDDFFFLMTEIQRKCREKAGYDVTASADQTETSSEVLPASKWYHISDSSVVEVSEEKVLKSQAYLLLFERVK